MGYQARARRKHCGSLRGWSAPRSSCRLVASSLFGIGSTKARNRIGVGGALGVAEIDPRPWLIIEISMEISAAHQHRGQLRLARATDMGRDIADAKPECVKNDLTNPLRV
jgi:hypothetical protein